MPAQTPYAAKAPSRGTDAAGRNADARPPIKAAAERPSSGNADMTPEGVLAVLDAVAGAGAAESRGWTAREIDAHLRRLRGDD